MKLQGKIKGRTIEFEEPLGLQDGQAVEVEIHTVDEPVSTNSSDGEPGCSPQETDDEETGTSIGRAADVFPAIPAGGKLVTNEMVNELREQLGI